MKELLLALPGGMDSRGKEYGLTPAPMAYRVAQGPRLLGARLPAAARGGVMERGRLPCGWSGFFTRRGCFVRRRSGRMAVDCGPCRRME